MGVDLSEAGFGILGVLTACVVGGLGSALTIKLRRRDYVRAKEKPAQPPFALPAVPVVKRTEAEAREDHAISLMLRSHHESSKSLQDNAVAHLVAACATLFVAFVSAVASATVLRAWHPAHVFSACLDVASLAIVIWTFWQSGKFRAAWVRERAISELIRQWTATEFLLVRTPGVITAPYDAFVARTNDALKSDHPDIIKAVVEYGRLRLAEIRRRIASAPTISKDHLRYYLYRRPIYQAGWFATSEARILNQREHRGQIMAALFGIALFASVGELIAIIAQAVEAAEWAVLVLMVAIGLGTAATSSYVGQNLRSLGHRYGQQVRAIERWFEEHDEIIALAKTDAPLQTSDISKLAIAVANFEALMLTEAVDWIGITQHDAMELGPT